MVQEKELMDICFFGYMGYIRKKGVWYYKPYKQYLAYFGGKDITYQNPVLEDLVTAVKEIILCPEVAG